MARILTVSFAVLMLAFPALGAGMADTASATCKDYETGSHQDMLDIAAAVHQALKGDPNRVVGWRDRQGLHRSTRRQGDRRAAFEEIAAAKGHGLAARVLAGELSAHAGMIKAGFRSTAAIRIA
jgi:hypothetical protein